MTLPILTAHDLGRPTEPGEYAYREALVSVDRQHLERWRADPDAGFHTILRTRVNDRSLRLTLGSAAP